jgi:Holliday junction resolvase
MAKMSRDKGKRGELEVVHVFRGAGIPADRTAALQAGGVEGEADVRVGVPGLHVEVKRDEHKSVDAMVRQAEADAPEGAVPVVTYRRNGQPWRAVVPLPWLVSLLKDTETTR